MKAKNQTLPRPLPAANRFSYGLPAWGAQLLRLAFLGVGAGLLALAWLAAVRSAPLYGIALPGAMGALFLIIAVRAVPTVYFLADEAGMYFPESRSHFLLGGSGEIRWLFVPWANVSGIRVTRIRQTDYVSFSVAASEEEERRFFGNLADRKRVTAGNVDAQGHLIAAYTNAFVAAERAVATLSRLRSAAS